MRRIVHLLYRHTRTLILIPHPQAVGTASEEIFFGLLAARRSHRRLLVLFPTAMPWPLKSRLIPIDFFDLESPLLWCSPAARRLLPLRFLISCYFAAARVWEYVKRKVNLGSPSDSEVGTPSGGQELLWSDNPASTVFSMAEVEGLQWSSQYAQRIEWRVGSNTERVGRDALRKWGISDQDWWVCFHVRESGFYGDHESSPYRNADVRSYMGAMREVIERGGWVVRLGDPSMAKIPVADRVIDLAHDPLKSPRLDAFFIQNCAAFVGMQSGLMDSAILFGKPLLITNMYGWLIGLPYLTNSWGVFQHLRDLENSVPVPVVQTMEGSTESLTSDWGLATVTYQTLSEDEITRAVADFLTWVAAGCPARESPYSDLRRRLFLDFLENNRLRTDDVFDVQTKYRLASRATPSAFNFTE